MYLTPASNVVPTFALELLPALMLENVRFADVFDTVTVAFVVPPMPPPPPLLLLVVVVVVAAAAAVGTLYTADMDCGFVLCELNMIEPEVQL